MKLVRCITTTFCMPVKSKITFALLLCFHWGSVYKFLSGLCKTQTSWECSIEIHKWRNNINKIHSQIIYKFSKFKNHFSSQPMLQLSGRPFTIGDLHNSWVTQTFPNTSPTSDQRISVDNLHVQSTQTMQPCQMSGYDNRIILFSILMWDHQNLCRPPSITTWWSTGQPRIFC